MRPRLPSPRNWRPVQSSIFKYDSSDIARNPLSLARHPFWLGIAPEYAFARSSIVTAIARNGVTSAIRVSGLAARWFEAPADVPTGLYFAGFAQHDANPDLGDSAICETAGYGGQSLAAAPALVQLAGGTVADAIAITREMHDIAWARNPDMALPYLDFAGAPAGIDVRKVVDNGIRPVLTTGIAHRQAGIGQIGAGMVRVPMACFTQALRALVDG